MRWHAENIVLNFPYAYFPDEREEANSNSAAFAVANRASEAGAVPLPESYGAFGYPGTDVWRTVRFASSVP